MIPLCKLRVIRTCVAQPDGNCLYRAVEDQLRLSGGGEPAAEGAAVPSHSELRGRAVAHMRDHEDEFLPFFAQVTCRSKTSEPDPASLGAKLMLQVPSTGQQSDPMPLCLHREAPRLFGVDTHPRECTRRGFPEFVHEHGRRAWERWHWPYAKVVAPQRHQSQAAHTVPVLSCVRTAMMTMGRWATASTRVSRRTVQKWRRQRRGVVSLSWVHWRRQAVVTDTVSVAMLQAE